MIMEKGSFYDKKAYSTCYMCACRCGIEVYLRKGKVVYIKGNPEHPTNRGVLCAKGSAGIMKEYSPARLRKPLLRVGERGSGEFKEIEWDEAIRIAVEWIGSAMKKNPHSIAFFTGRDQMQAINGWFAGQIGTINWAAHGGFCSVNVASAGLLSIGSSFWEFGEADFERTKYFMMVGVAEDHSSNPIKLRDKEGNPLIFDRKTGKFCPASRIVYDDLDPAFIGEFETPEGFKVRPAFDLFAERLVKEYYPERVEAITGIKAEDIDSLSEAH